MPVSTSPTAVEVTGFSPIEYLTGRVSGSRQEVLTSSHTLPTSEGSQSYSKLVRIDTSRTGSKCSTAQFGLARSALSSGLCLEASPTV
jgi:hypothetical protein